MRRALLLTCLFLGVYFCHAQESNKTARFEPIKPQSTESKSSQPSDLAKIQSKIREYDVKINYFESHPEEKKIALENGSLVQLQSERDALIKLANAQIQPTQRLSSGSNNLTAVGGAEIETIEHIDSVIAAIDSKVEWAKSDQTENQKAIEAGYYEMMEAQKQKLLLKRAELVNQQKSNK